MKPVLNITNADVFNWEVENIDLSGLKSRERRPNEHYWVGDVDITLAATGEHRTFSGEHGISDFEKEYGFQIVPV